MKWNDLSMTERADIIALGVQSGITDLNTIRHTYNSLSEGYLDGNNVVFPKRHRYDGSTEETQQMNRVNYYNPITGENYGSTMPKGMVRARNFSNLTPEAQDEYMYNHPTTLDEVVVTPDKSIGDVISDIFSKENWNAHKEQAKEAASYLPIVGDAIDVYDAGKSAYNGKYLDAGIGLGLAFLPNFIEKPMKWAKKVINPSAISSFIRHPFYKTYYHGSPVQFDINHAWMGTEYDMGLHVSRDPKVAKLMAENGFVYKIRAPRAKVTASDLSANDFSHLSTSKLISSDETWKPGYFGVDFNMQDTNLLDDLNKSGIEYRLTKNPSYNDDFRYLQTKDNFYINARDRFTRGLSPKQKRAFDKEADALLEETEIFKLRENQDWKVDINTKASELLDRYGITTVKYPNRNPFEGIKESFWINNPAKIDLISVKSSNKYGFGGLTNEILIPELTITSKKHKYADTTERLHI